MKKQLLMMKKMKSLFLAVLFCTPLTVTATDIEINAENFPDEKFRNWLLEQWYDKNGVLTVEELTYMDVTNQGISSLKGIELLTSLEYLKCEGNLLTSLDLSQNAAIWYINCTRNQLVSIDISGCTALSYLNCYDNQLTTLDVSNNLALETLYCDVNQITSLNVSGCAALTRIVCYRNQIKGEAMDSFINSLPNRENCSLYISNKASNVEGNVCTGEQAMAIKSKGWSPLYNNGIEWLEYGSNLELEGNGTQESPYTVVDAIRVGYQLEYFEKSAEKYYIKGKIVNIRYTFDEEHGTALFYIADEDNPKEITFTAYSVYYLENRSWVDGYQQIALGDEVILYGTITNGYGNAYGGPRTPEKEAYIYSLNGETSGIDISVVMKYDNAEAPIYTLSGQKVTSPTNAKKGIYIVDGKKVVVK